MILRPLSDGNSVCVGLWVLCWTITGLLWLSLLLVCVQGWQVHNRNLGGFPQHHIAFEITLSSASYKKMDNKIYIFSAVY